MSPEEREEQRKLQETAVVTYASEKPHYDCELCDVHSNCAEHTTVETDKHPYASPGAASGGGANYCGAGGVDLSSESDGWKERFDNSFSQDNLIRVDQYQRIKDFISTELKTAREEERHLQEKLKEIAINFLITDVNTARKEERLQTIEEIESKLPKVIHTLEELLELNKHLPSTIAEQSYLESVGWIKCLEEVKYEKERMDKR
jgi:hypothetical protein